MDRYIIHEFRTSDGIYKVDYESLANLPESGEGLVPGEGIRIEREQGGESTISVTQELSDNIKKLMDKNFPVTAAITSSSGFGNHEIGDVITASISWSVTREVEPYTITGSLVTPMISRNGGSSWTSETSFTEGSTYTRENITTDTSIKILVQPPDSSQNIVLGPRSVNFLDYRYYGVLNSRPPSITESLIKSLSTSELSNSKTLGTTNLASGKYFLFAVPGTPNLVVRHAGTDSIIDSEIGTIGVSRKNGTSGLNAYSWVLVPASSINWSFVIKSS